MKRMLTILLCAAMSLALLAGCASAQADTGASDAAALVMDIPTTQYFTKEAVDAVDVEKIDVAFRSAKGEIPVCRNGAGIPFSEDKAKETLTVGDEP